MIVAVLQARMSSTRLPGKVLAEVLGMPMILRQIERLRRCSELDEIVVATSVDRSDDGLAAELSNAGVAVQRGPLTDVAARFALAIGAHPADSLVRLTADCPLADHEVIDRVIREHLECGADYSSNTLERTYPQGLDVECVRSDAFVRMLALPLDADEREHVTMAIYRRPKEFTVHSVKQEDDHSLLRWTVDRPDDLDFVRTVYGRLHNTLPDFAQADILALLEREPGLNHTN